MFGLGRHLATVRPGPAALEVEPATGPAFAVPVSALPWIMVLRAGDAFFADEAGWWLFAQPDGPVLALSTNCPGLEAALQGSLRPTLDGAGTLLWLDLAEPPPSLRGRAARLGWARLDATAAALLRNDPSARILRCIADAPALP